LRKRLNAAALALLLAACGAPPARSPAPHPSSPPPEPPPASSPAPPATSPEASAAGARGTAYRIDSSHSELRLLVYRAGVMAALGHDHVIINRAIEGWVNPGDSLAGAAFFLSIPTSGFVVDEAAARAQEGDDFSEEVGDDAKAGTLHNMLSPAILDAQSHASITVRSISIEAAPAGAQVPAGGAEAQAGGGARVPAGGAKARAGGGAEAQAGGARVPAGGAEARAGGGAEAQAGGARVPPAEGQGSPPGEQATVRISVAGHESTLVVPFTLDTSAGRLHARAEFTVRQTALGLTPFTALLGALRVEDQLRLKLDLVANRD
jgi:hypothetical protein